MGWILASPSSCGAVPPCPLSITLHPSTNTATNPLFHVLEELPAFDLPSCLQFFTLFPLLPACGWLFPHLSIRLQTYILRDFSACLFTHHLLKVCSSFKFPRLVACRCWRWSVEQHQAGLWPGVCSVKAGKNLCIVSLCGTGVNGATSKDQE